MERERISELVRSALEHTTQALPDRSDYRRGKGVWRQRPGLVRHRQLD